jgi:hypothetical protein
MQRQHGDFLVFAPIAGYFAMPSIEDETVGTVIKLRQGL